MTFVDEIISAFEALGGVAHYSELYEFIENNSKRVLPLSWKENVRARIEERSSDSMVFLGKEDLFYAAEGIGKGVWGLRSMISIPKVAIDIEEPRQSPPRSDVKTTRIIRDTTVTRQLKALYKNECQICTRFLDFGDRRYSEAHHIHPLGKPHNGLDIISNIVIVCPNHHAEFDYGVIAIDPAALTIVHLNRNNHINGRDLTLNPHHNLDREALAYHMDNIFRK